MIFECLKHGAHIGILVSPDLLEESSESTEVVDIAFEYLGLKVSNYYVSKHFAKRYGVPQGTIPLPEEGGFDWEDLMECCCAKCFEEIHDGFFIEFRFQKNEETK